MRLRHQVVATRRYTLYEHSFELASIGLMYGTILTSETHILHCLAIFTSKSKTEITRSVSPRKVGCWGLIRILASVLLSKLQPGTPQS